MNFPKHACSLSLEHNEHKDYYQTAADWVAEKSEFGPEFKDEDSQKRAIEIDEIWTLIWFPNTPVGSYHIAAPTLEELLDWAAEIEKSYL